MYRALAHQCELNMRLDLVDGCDALKAHHVLRRKAAAHVASHSDEFAPFVVDSEKPAPAAEQMEAFCEGILALEWGTQVELQALAAALQVPIQVRLPQMRSAFC
jgi:hypothetical protein